jgi:hypothetical protein
MDATSKSPAADELSARYRELRRQNSAFCRAVYAVRKEGNRNCGSDDGNFAGAGPAPICAFEFHTVRSSKLGQLIRDARGAPGARQRDRPTLLARADELLIETDATFANSRIVSAGRAEPPPPSTQFPAVGGLPPRLQMQAQILELDV